MTKPQHTIQFVCYTAKDGHRWRLKSGRKIMADSGEAYATRASAVRAVKRVMAIAGTAEIVAGYAK